METSSEASYGEEAEGLKAREIPEPSTADLKEVETEQREAVRKREEHERRYTVGMARQYIKDIGMVQPLSFSQEAELAQRAQQGERLAWQRLIGANLSLVVSYMYRFKGRGVAKEDLIQEGNLGLIEAIGKFDHTKGVPLGIYAGWWIRGAMLHAVQQASLVHIPTWAQARARIRRTERKIYEETGHWPDKAAVVAEIGKIATKDWIRRNDYDYAAPVISYELPVDSDDDTTLKDVIPHPIDDLPQYVLEKEYLRQEVKECLSQLAKSEREFIELRFGFTDGTAYDRTEIAASWKLPIKEVILLERRAMQSLRNLPQVRRLKQEFLDI